MQPFDPRYPRRDWLAACGRWAIASLLLLLSAVLARRGWRAGCSRPDSACRLCDQATACALFPARVHRLSQRG